MADPRQYLFRVRTVHRIYLVALTGLYLLSLVVVLYFAWRGRVAFLRDLHSPDREARINAWVLPLLTVMVLAIVLGRLLDMFHRRERSPRGVAATLDEERIALTDERGQTTEFPWYSLEDVLVFPRNKRGTGMVFLLAGDRSAFIPESVRDPEDLLAEILRRGGLVLVEEAPGYRRYGRRG